ncbi:restriction endonuclease subunit S [Yokenella regensburgei]
MSDFKFHTPNSWILSSLPDIAGINMGQSPSSSDVNEQGEGIVFFQGKAEFGKLYPTPRKYCTKPTKIASAGDILLSIRAPVGPTNIATETTAIGRGLAAISAHSGLTDPKYLLYYFRCIEPWLSTQGTGSTFKAISGQFIKELKAPLPSFAEQKIIAEKLDTLLAQVDSTKARLEQIPQILKRFRQAVLEEAVSGRLTENWRDASISEKSAEELLVTISKTRKKNLTSGADSLATESKRYLAKIDAHHFNIPDVILPVGWKWTTFLQSMEKVVDCHNKTAPYTEKGIYLIRTPDIRNGIISLKNTKYVNEDTYNFWSKRCPPRSGDIIFTREAPMGEAGIVPENTRLCMGQRMMLLRPMQSYLSNKYVLLNILSISFQARMLSQAIGTGVKHLRVADVESLMYPLPPLPEQHEIVRRVEQLFAYADTIEKQVNSALTRVNNLTQSILAKAFRGELTAQWRAENPDLISGENSAAALLEKIKAERAASGGKKTSRKKA